VLKTLRVAAAYAQEHDDAMCTSFIHRAMELNPSDSAPHYSLAELMEREGHPSEATLEWRTALQLDGDQQLVDLFDRTSSKSGFPVAKRAVTETLLERMAARAKTNYVSPRNFVELYVRIGDKENALRWLDTAFAEHSSFLVQITHDPSYESLGTDPRFRAMLHRMRAPGAR
jgi:hypothetical protein